MKLFAILAVLFFTWRVFAQSFEYSHIEDYMRAQTDPYYAQYLADKAAEEKRLRVGVEEYKDEKFYDLQVQEQLRADYVAQKNSNRQPASEGLEQEHQRQLEKEHQKYLVLQKEYALQNEPALQPNYWTQNRRFVASLESRKVIPKKDRKFKFKNPAHK